MIKCTISRHCILNRFYTKGFCIRGPQEGARESMEHLRAREMKTVFENVYILGLSKSVIYTTVQKFYFIQQQCIKT